MSDLAPPSTNKILDNRSLRKKMSVGRNSLQYSKKDETKIILLENDQNPRHEKIEKLNRDFEIEVKKWNSRYCLNEIDSPDIDEKYKEITNKLYNHFEKFESNFFNLKQLISDSGAKSDILNLPRALRQKIYRRLENLLAQGGPIVEIFNDERVRKIIISDTTRVLFVNESLLEKRINIFKSKSENKLFKRVLDIISKNISDNQLTLPNPLSQKILVKPACDDSSNQTYILKRIQVKSPSLLELMREGTLTLEGGNFLIKVFKSKSSGVLICGKSNAGKTRALLALTTTLANSRFTAITAELSEFKNSIKDFKEISREFLITTIQRKELDYLADSIAASAINLYIADDCTGNELALAWLLHVKHNIPSIISYNGHNCLNSILHLSNSAINTLNYSSERSYFFWNLVRTFPILLDLNKVGLRESEILQHINFNNDMLTLKNIPLDFNQNKQENV